jgi:Glycosyltransferase
MFCNDVSFITDINDGSKKILEIHFSKFKRLQYGRKGLWALADKYRTKQDEKLVKKFDKFIVLTKEDASYWGNLKNMQVIYNASPFKTDLISPLENKKVIAIGRYTYQKGFDMLLKTWEQVNKHLPDWNLNIIGDGEPNEISQLKTLIDKYNISNSVTLVKPTSNIEKEYLSSSLLVMSSRYEGLPMILIEAQTFGLPIVAFDCKCGPKDVITNGVDGYIVPQGDITAFSEKIMTIIENEDLRKKMGERAKLASKRFNEDVIMQQWITLFKEVLQ